MNEYTATYDPADNKLRLRAVSRLPKELYEQVRAAGFIWAPKQELFVAPMWTPEREDFLLTLVDEIGDEDTSLVDRAEQRADRFQDYSAARKDDAAAAHKAVESICEHIPLGQPILVGHHSERHARKDAERIENGMRRAVKMWDQAQYWKSRAAGALRHAKYLERPDVRARRIKKIEADKRGRLRDKAEAELALKFWSGQCHMKGEILPIIESNRETIFHVIGNSSTLGHWGSYPGIDGTLTYSLWDVLRPDGERYKNCPSKTIAEVQDLALRSIRRAMARYDRWLAHYDNRLAYEHAMLQEGGGLEGEKLKDKYEVGGRVNVLRYGWSLITRVNRRNGEVISLSIAGVGWRGIGLEEVQDYKAPSAEDAAKVKQATKTPPLCNYPGEGFLHQTKEEWEKTVPQWSDFPKIGRMKATDKHGAHRVRQNRKPGGNAWEHVCVFITDLKRTDPPAATAPVKLDKFVPPAPSEPESKPLPVKSPEPDAEQATIAAMKETLKAGVQVVAAPQLFPTPAPLAARMVEKAFEHRFTVQIGANMNERCRVLEPSAGTGNLIAAVSEAAKSDCASGGFRTSFDLVAVEVNLNLAHALAAKFPQADIRRTDFLTCNGDLGKFDRIVMNPPFERGSDIEHIKHAMTFLADGGRLVAICANGPRQREELEPLCDEWHDLEPGTFKESGTMVNAAMIVINK